MCLHLNGPRWANRHGRRKTRKMLDPSLVQRLLLAVWHVGELLRHAHVATTEGVLYPFDYVIRNAGWDRSRRHFAPQFELTVSPRKSSLAHQNTCRQRPRYLICIRAASGSRLERFFARSRGSPRG